PAPASPLPPWRVRPSLARPLQALARGPFSGAMARPPLPRRVRPLWRARFSPGTVAPASALARLSGAFRRHPSVVEARFMQGSRESGDDRARMFGSRAWRQRERLPERVTPPPAGNATGEPHVPSPRLSGALRRHRSVLEARFMQEPRESGDDHARMFRVRAWRQRDRLSERVTRLHPPGDSTGPGRRDRPRATRPALGDRPGPTRPRTGVRHGRPDRALLRSVLALTGGTLG
ncbi:MAG: hypothetical protein QOE66_3319, partial [Chloroflexota bacterium]|nr:hypothetical protein [Chloroflexota bacterium]